MAALFGPLYPVLDYAMNKDYIARVYCENKEKPKMHCNGKCHLMKQLKKAAEQTPRSHAVSIVSENFFPHYSPTSDLITPKYSELPFTLSDLWQEPVSSVHLLSVFRPPQS